MLAGELCHCRATPIPIITTLRAPELHSAVGDSFDIKSLHSHQEEVLALCFLQKSDPHMCIFWSMSF